MATSELLDKLTAVLHKHQVYWMGENLQCSGCDWKLAVVDAPPDAPSRHKAEMVEVTITEHHWTAEPDPNYRNAWDALNG